MCQVVALCVFVNVLVAASSVACLGHSLNRDLCAPKVSLQPAIRLRQDPSVCLSTESPDVDHNLGRDVMVREAFSSAGGSLDPSR